MKALTIRNIPDDLYRVIVKLAKRNRRSIQQQTLVLLDRARALDMSPPTETARNIRLRLSGRHLGDTVKEVHQERRR